MRAVDKELKNIERVNGLLTKLDNDITEAIKKEIKKIISKL